MAISSPLDEALLKQLDLRPQITASPHQKRIDSMRRLTSFADGPDDQALAAADVAGGEDAGKAGGVVPVALYVAASVEFQAQLSDGAIVFGVNKAQGEQAQITIQFKFARGGFLHREAAGGILG